MPKLSLNAGQERPIAVSGRYLSIINSSAAFSIEGDFGVLVGEVGRVIELEDYNRAIFKNESAQTIDIEYETVNVKVHAAGKGVVSVSNAIEISRIRESIQVEANAVVENGKMSILPSNNFESIPVNKTVIGAGQSMEVFAARPSDGRTAIIQIISDSENFTPVRIGTTIANVENGIYLAGNIKNPSAYEFETQTAVIVKNTGDEQVTLAGGEKWRG